MLLTPSRILAVSTVFFSGVVGLATGAATGCGGICEASVVLTLSRIFAASTGFFAGVEPVTGGAAACVVAGFCAAGTTEGNGCDGEEGVGALTRDADGGVGGVAGLAGFCACGAAAATGFGVVTGCGESGSFFAGGSTLGVFFFFSSSK